LITVDLALKSDDKPLESSPGVPKPETKRRGGGKPFRSKLEPYFEEIRAARKAKKTWVEIADQLKGRVETTPQGVFYFFKSKRRKKYALGMEPDEPDQPPASVPAGPAQPAAGVRPRPKPPAPPGSDDDLLEPVVEETVSERKVRELREKRQKNPPTK
jgi:hypothetical protein